MKEAVQIMKFGIVFFVIAMLCINGNAQDNSPWRKVNEEILILKNVYFAPGCHQHSLTGGQGFSVYIKNQNSQTVFVKGNLVAKTYCGKDIVSAFTVTLKAKEVSNGVSYDDPDNNGQAGVVSPAECKGVNYTVKVYRAHNPHPRYIKYTNRIKTVKLANVEVIFTDTLVTKKKEVVKPVAKEENYDALVDQKLLWYQHVDSLTKEIRTLQFENNRLNDSLTYYRFMNDQLKSYIQLAKQPQPSTTTNKKSKKKKGKAETTNPLLQNN